METSESHYDVVLENKNERGKGKGNPQKVTTRWGRRRSSDQKVGRFHVKAIGRGGFGHIYYASDLVFPDDVVIKIEPIVRRGSTNKGMLLEQKILYRLQERPHVPIMCASGYTEELNFIVIQLLRPNIGDLKKRSPAKRLIPSTVARIIIQGIAALRDVHSLGYIHRDVKPANMCIGITQNVVSTGILLLKIIGKVPGGTLRYASVRVHDRKDQTPADDLMLMAYSGVEFLLVNLPWKLLYVEELRNAKVYFTMMGEKAIKDAYDWEQNYRDACGNKIISQFKASSKTILQCLEDAATNKCTTKNECILGE